MIDIAAHLAHAKMNPDEARAKARIFDRAHEALGVSPGEAFAVFVPGRIEVLGKHTDYAGGRSLLCAAERGFCLVATPRKDRHIHLTDVVSGERAETVLEPRLPAGEAGWSVYVATVARRLARNFPAASRGADIAFGSDLPMAAGLSSSSALVTSAMLALSTLNDLPAEPAYRAAIRSNEDLAEYLGTIENGQDFGTLTGDAGVGTFGGSEDHTAMLCCQPGELSQYSFCPVHHERQLVLPEDYRFVIAVSGVAAEKTGAARETYNNASASARRVLERWNAVEGRSDATLRAAVESAPDAAERLRAELDTSLRPRFDQFVEETFAIVPRVGDLLARGRIREIGELVERSQRGAEIGLGNQIAETVFLADFAVEQGALAASAFGAGFGGSVWALVETEQAEPFSTEWSEGYARAFPQHANRARFFATGAGPAAVRIA